ncbi:MAG: regulatory protein GemA [Desulfovibrio sp.]|jgi:hypothetical protein|nr:regulatory protein GemA [Desulfovibrio sp.]
MAIITKFPSARRVPAAPADPGSPHRKRDPSIRGEQRKMMLAKVHIALKDLQKLDGWSEDTYRFGLMERFGKDSAKDLTRDELHQTLLWLSSLGWRAKPGRHRKGAPVALEGEDLSHLDRQALLSKIEAQLAEKGRAEGTDMPWGYAEAILKRQTGGVIKSFDHALPDQLRGVLAALWKDAKRKGRYTGPERHWGT